MAVSYADDSPINLARKESGYEESRPHNDAIAQRISSTSPSRWIILDTFCLNGYTLVESFNIRRKR